MDRIVFDNNTDADSVVAHDNPLPIAGVAGGTEIPVSSATIGLTSDVKLENADDNSPLATLAAIEKGILGAALSAAPVPTYSTGVTMGSTTPHRKILAATNNATDMKVTPGQLYSYDIASVRTTPFYVKFYDMDEPPDPATDTPVWVVGVPGSTTVGSRVAHSFPNGLQFVVGIAYAVVTGIGNTDNTPVAAGDGALNLEYA